MTITICSPSAALHFPASLPEGPSAVPRTFSSPFPSPFPSADGAFASPSASPSAYRSASPSASAWPRAFPTMTPRPSERSLSADSIPAWLSGRSLSADSIPVWPSDAAAAARCSAISGELLFTVPHGGAAAATSGSTAAADVALGDWFDEVAAASMVQTAPGVLRRKPRQRLMEQWFHDAPGGLVSLALP
ncbi:unnamed protein product [Closterium sp. Yama58-4]|nr:unnamed protein product [Closterium sp. Yama58-4]